MWCAFQRLLPREKVALQERSAQVRLHPVKHDLKTTLWCGLAAISTITGRRTSLILRELKDGRGHNGAIKGVGPNELSRVLARSGYDLIRQEHYRPDERPTLCQWHRDRTLDQAVRVVIAGDHYIVVQGIRMFDSFNPAGTYLKPGRTRVKAVWLVVPRRVPT